MKCYISGVATTVAFTYIICHFHVFLDIIAHGLLFLCYIDHLVFNLLSRLDLYISIIMLLCRARGASVKTVRSLPLLLPPRRRPLFCIRLQPPVTACACYVSCPCHCLRRLMPAPATSTACACYCLCLLLPAPAAIRNVTGETT